MENASNVNHAFDPQAYIRKQQSIELANHIAPERSSNGKVVRRSLIDSQPANQDGVVAPASFDVTARVPNRVRRSLADSTLGTSEEASVEEDTPAVELPTEGAGRDKLTLEKASQPRQSEEGSGALKPLTFSLKKLKPLLDVPRLK